MAKLVDDKVMEHKKIRNVSSHETIEIADATGNGMSWRLGCEWWWDDDFIAKWIRSDERNCIDVFRNRVSSFGEWASKEEWNARNIDWSMVKHCMKSTSTELSATEVQLFHRFECVRNHLGLWLLLFFFLSSSSPSSYFHNSVARWLHDKIQIRFGRGEYECFAD